MKAPLLSRPTPADTLALEFGRELVETTRKLKEAEARVEELTRELALARLSLDSYVASR